MSKLCFRKRTHLEEQPLQLHAKVGSFPDPDHLKQAVKRWNEHEEQQTDHQSMRISADRDLTFVRQILLVSAKQAKKKTSFDNLVTINAGTERLDQKLEQILQKMRNKNQAAEQQAEQQKLVVERCQQSLLSPYCWTAANPACHSSGKTVQWPRSTNYQTSCWLPVFTELTSR